jgi:hypothetical protein
LIVVDIRSEVSYPTRHPSHYFQSILPYTKEASA